MSMARWTPSRRAKCAIKGEKTGGVINTASDPGGRDRTTRHVRGPLRSQLYSFRDLGPPWRVQAIARSSAPIERANPVLRVAAGVHEIITFRGSAVPSECRRLPLTGRASLRHRSGDPDRRVRALGMLR
jgi:hypothetical protein